MDSHAAPHHHPAPSGPTVAELVRAAEAGDRSAWDALVARYAPLVTSIVRGYRLQDSDVRDVVQTVWLRLIEHLGSLREPRALPGWLITTARNETLRTLKTHGRARPMSPYLETEADLVAEESLDADLLRVERREAVLQAFAELSERDRELIRLLSLDPAPSYVEIAQRLQIAIGSIGPTRARILDKVRAYPAVASLLTSADETAYDRTDRRTGDGRRLGL